MMISTELLATVTLLNGDGALRLISAILAYDNDQEFPTLTGKEALLWPLIKDKLDEQKRQEAAIKQRQEAGKAGARRRWNGEPHSEPYGEPYGEQGSEPYSENDSEQHSEPHSEQHSETDSDHAVPAITPDSTTTGDSNDGDNSGDRESMVDTVSIVSEVSEVSNNNIYTTSISTEREKKETTQRKKRETKPDEPRIVYAEYVTMTATEYGKLINAYGVTAARRMVEILNSYKGANGKTYKSDYFAILNWVVDRWKEEEASKKKPPSFRYAPPEPAAQTTRAQQFAKLEAAALEPL